MVADQPERVPQLSDNPSRIVIASKADLNDLPPTQPVLVLPVVDGLTAQEYARQTGQNVRSVQEKMRTGALPIIKTKKRGGGSGKNTTPLVNVHKLVLDALTKAY